MLAVVGPSQDPAGGIDVSRRKVEAELGLRAVKLDTARERQHRTDLDRLRRLRRPATGQPSDG